MITKESDFSENKNLIEHKIELSLTDFIPLMRQLYFIYKGLE